MLMVTFSVLASVVICNIYFRSTKTHRLPPFMQGKVWHFVTVQVFKSYLGGLTVRRRGQAMTPWNWKTSTVLFINHIARLLKIKRPEPFEIEIPKTDTFSNDGSADDERTNDLLYGHELGGIDKGALVSFKSEFSSPSGDRWWVDILRPRSWCM